jgi:hypothetical protein
MSLSTREPRIQYFLPQLLWTRRTAVSWGLTSPKLLIVPVESGRSVEGRLLMFDIFLVPDVTHPERDGHCVGRDWWSGA